MTAIVADGVGKRYRKLDEQAMLLRSILPFSRPTRTDFWALRDFDLRVEEGETVGVLGRNGAGKTTLLRMLAGVTRPTEGRVHVEGPIAPLISVGVGFQREMSGRENVLLNGMLLGLSREEVAERFDDIVAFAELADFIDTPVKFYSSGMFMRLGFAVAIHVHPRVLLIDEVLAVGDAAFQNKCFERMRELRTSGTTVVVVSHNMGAIRYLCPRSVLIVDGGLDFDGDTQQAITRYYDLLSSGTLALEGIDEHEQRFVGGARILRRQLAGWEGKPVPSGMPVTYRASVQFERPVESPMFMFFVHAEDGRLVYGHHSPLFTTYRTYEAGDAADVELRFTPRSGAGVYHLSMFVGSSDWREVFVVDGEGVRFSVAPRPATWGPADLEAEVFVDGHQLLGERAVGYET